MSSIQLNAIEKSYGDVLALDGVNISVHQGELLTILGPSGSGKTTLLSLIAGLTVPTKGSIYFGDRDVTNLAPAGREVGLVFQNYALFPNMSAFDNIAFPLSIRKVSRTEIKRRVAEVLDMVRLKGVGDRQPNQLSGGQQQRVALARALIFRPPIVLLDEPLGALDRQLREELQVELKELQRSLGVTMVLVTHDQEEALSLSDRIVVLDKGQVQQIAAPSEAYLRPANRFVAEFLGIANFVRMPDGREALVRPERLQIDLASEGQSSGLHGRVRQRVYLGQAVRIYVAVDDGAELVVALSSSDVAARMMPGDRVRMSWQSEDVWHLP